MTTTVDAYKTSKPSGAFAAVAHDESLSDGIGSSYPVIRYKGKIFSLAHRGENHIFLRPDDGTPVGYLDVVILRQARVKAKSYYPDGYEENASAGKRPTCSSIDGVRPDPEINPPQAKLCALCPRNEWRTDAQGRKGRECTDYKRLAVLILPHQTAKFFGAPLMEPAFLRIPPDSLQDLGTFGDNLASQGWPYMSFITRISFDPAKSHPKFVFKFQQGLTDQEAPTVLALREELTAKRVTGEDEIARRALLAPPPAGAPAAAFNQSVGQDRIAADTTAAVAATSVPPANAAAVQQSGLKAGAFGLTPPAAQPLENTLTVPQEQTQVRTVLPAQTVDLAPQAGGAFGLAPPPPEPNPSPQPGAMVGQDASDVGNAVEDPDLDAKIKAMLATG